MLRQVESTMRLNDVTPAQVALRTDKAICAKAAVAFDKTLIPELKRSTYAPPARSPL